MARGNIGRGLYLTLVGLVYAFLLTPLVVVVLASFNSGEYLTFPPEGFSFRWYVKFFNSASFMQSLWFSLQLALICTVCSTVLGTMVALYVVRFAGRWRDWLRLLIIMPLLLPEILTAIALLFFYYNIEALLDAIGLEAMSGLFRNSFLGLLIGHVLITLPFVFLGISASLYNFDMALEEAARSLGADKFTTFRRITLPLVKPGIIAGGLLAFIISFDLFNMSLLLKGVGTATLPIQLFDYVRWDFDPTAAAVSSVSIAITLLAIVVTERLVGLHSLRF
jgi:putative spermidine/putrescine transport system permease protein